MHVLARHFDLVDIKGIRTAKVRQDVFDEHLRCRGTRGYAKCGDPLERNLRQIVGALYEKRTCRAGLFGDLDQAQRV